MKLLILDRNGLLSDEGQEYARRRIHFALSRFATKIDRVTAVFSDDNGPRGGIDKVCRITVKLRRLADIRHADALVEDLDALLAADAPWQVAANLPYSVGTAILRRLLPRHDLFTRIVVMLQLEVVNRLVARPAGKGHGLMALERAAHAEAHVAFTVPPGAFKPRPKVNSAVVVLDLRPAPHPEESLRAAFDLAGRALTRPRKVLTNALTPTVAAAQLEAAGIDPSARPGMLELADWVRLADVLRGSADRTSRDR